MKPHFKHFLVIPVLATLAVTGCVNSGNNAASSSADATLDPLLVAQGKEIFRSDTFGDEAF